MFWCYRCHASWSRVCAGNWSLTSLLYLVSETRYVHAPLPLDILYTSLWALNCEVLQYGQQQQNLHRQQEIVHGILKGKDVIMGDAGKRLLPASPPTQSQQTASSKTSWQEPQYFDNEVATEQDVKKSNVEGSEEQVKHANRDQDVQIENLQGTQKYGDRAPSKESKQRDFDQNKEDQWPPTSEPVAKNSSTRAEKKKSPGLIFCKQVLMLRCQ